MTGSKRLGSYTARQNLMTHRLYRYRGCAPDVDNPRVAAGNVELPVTAWEAPDVDGGEDAAARKAREAAAIEVCVDCPVMVQCMAFGASLNRAGKLAVPHGILGGMTALERHKALVRERQEAQKAVPEPAPVEQLRTEQKLAVLRAFAVHADPVMVAAAAQEELRREFGDAYEFDVRTANWQRARITTQLGLPKTATRRQVLEAAVARGLLTAEEVAAGPAPSTVPVAAPPVQLSFDDALEGAVPASVTALFPAAGLEVAA